MSRRKWLAIVCPMFIASPAVQAEDPANAGNGPTLFAYQSLDCKQWARPNPFAGSYIRDWLINEIRAQAADPAYRVDIAKNVPTQTIADWVDGYCADRPLDGLGIAALRFMNTMAGQTPAAP